MRGHRRRPPPRQRAAQRRSLPRTRPRRKRRRLRRREPSRVRIPSDRTLGHRRRSRLLRGNFGRMLPLVLRAAAASQPAARPLGTTANHRRAQRGGQPPAVDTKSWARATTAAQRASRRQCPGRTAPRRRATSQRAPSRRAGLRRRRQLLLLLPPCRRGWLLGHAWGRSRIGSPSAAAATPSRGRGPHSRKRRRRGCAPNWSARASRLAAHPRRSPRRERHSSR